MGIYIKNIDIPIEQEYIDIRIHADGTATMPIGEHPYYRQLEITRVPVPHGKLIDADKAKDDMDYVCNAGGWLEPVTKAVNEYVKRHLDRATTVIEAEE